MVAHQVKERRFPNESAAAQQRMTVAAKRMLLDKLDPDRRILQRACVSLTVPGCDDDCRFVDAGAGGFLKDDPNRGLLRAVRIHQHLQWEPVLVSPCCCNDRFCDFHLSEEGATAGKKESITEGPNHRLAP